MDIIVQQNTGYGFGMIDAAGYERHTDYVVCLDIDSVRRALDPQKPQLLITGGLGFQNEHEALPTLKQLRTEFPLLVCVGFSFFEMSGPFERVIQKYGNQNRLQEIQAAINDFRDGKLTRTTEATPSTST